MSDGVMSDSGRPASEHELHAYADGQLDPVRRAEVAAFLAGAPEAQDRVAAYRAQNAAMHAAFDSTLREVLPARLLPRSRRVWPRLLRHAVAASIYVAVGWGAALAWNPQDVAALWQGNGPAEAGFPERAALAYATFAPEERRPVEIGADDETLLVGWLSSRLGADIRVPKLNEIGFEFIGGRLLPAPRGPAGQLIYADAQGRRVALYFKPRVLAPQNTDFRWLRQGAIEVCFWSDGGMRYAVTGELSRRELFRLVELIYEQLNV
jgi:anti-sigma factor RsiW